MDRNPTEIRSICEALLSNNIGEKALSVSITEFQKFYSTMDELTTSNPIVSFVYLEDIVVAQFSQLSPQHFFITNKKTNMSENDFPYVCNKIWYGGNKPTNRYLSFLFMEFKQNWKSLAIIFISSFLLLFFINDNSFNNFLISLIIQSATVFLSIYIIFTVSQSQNIYTDISLFKSGTLRKYYSDDKNVSLMGISTIGITLLVAGLLALFEKVDPQTIIHFEEIVRFIKSFFLSFVIALLFDTFFTIGNYYLFRSKDLIERNIVSEILHDDFMEYSNDNQ